MICKSQLVHMRDERVPWINIQGDWSRFQSELGELNGEDEHKVSSLTQLYTKETIARIDDRFS